MAASLYVEESIESWKRTYELYKEILERKADKQKKDKAKKLLELDHWFQHELPQEVSRRSERLLTQEELIKLMDWKLTRGKFRPRLTQLVKTNSDETVKEVTSRAFKCLPDVKSAINELTKLKAVGPATASAILCAGSPNIPFMADESIQAIPRFGNVKIDYTLKFYLCYLESIRSCLKVLLSKDSKGNWNEHKIELCLWAHVVGQKYAPELFGESSFSSKRKTSIQVEEYQGKSKRRKVK
ncbi:uncharacterized protein LOC114946908 isoform X1 [Acropora millepora]|uniref:uncharacterized protein LOC114946908 isoform X1 n=1 Tax=Acropora millepora TaxID=45264 RepID=UPI001CF3E8B1|nr:uncharacterized protein LOC114946908 isoform X1 [Acropora millepora]